jgi:hypothetical protein
MKLLNIALGLDYLRPYYLVYGCLHPSNFLFSDSYELSLDLSSCCYVHDTCLSRSVLFGTTFPHYSKVFADDLKSESFQAGTKSIAQGSPAA